MFGSAGPVVFASIVVLSVAASLMALLMMAPRLYVAMGHDGLFVPALATVDPATGTPDSGDRCCWPCWRACLSPLAPSIRLWRSSSARHWDLSPSRRRLSSSSGGVSPKPSAFQVPGYPLAPALFVLLVIGVVIIVGVSRPLQAMAGFALVMLGLPMYWKFKGQS